MSKPYPVTPKQKQYPLWYYNKRGVDKKGKPLSDCKFIMDRMAVIPAEHKDKIANRYEDIYQNKKTIGNRKRANTFLNKIARWFHKNKKYFQVEKAFVTPEKEQFITKPVIEAPSINEIKQKLRALNDTSKR